jgi:hypothetical protein
MKGLSNLDVLKSFFSQDGGKPLTNQEILKFWKDGGDTKELAYLAGMELGLVPTPTFVPFEDNID